MVEPAWTWSLEDNIPSSTDAGHQLIEKLLAALSEAGWEGRDFFHVQMAAEEAMVNAVTHGNGGEESKRVEVEFRVSKEQAKLRFKDEGEGFCPDELPDPRSEENLEMIHGRGVMLIREMMSEVSYNDCGNEVTMIKNREVDAEAAAS